MNKTLKNTLLGLTVASSTFLCGCNNANNNNTNLESKAEPVHSLYSGLATVTDLDGDGYPDVIYERNVSYGGKDAYIFKEGYGPSRSDAGMAVDIKYLEKSEFDQKTLPILMDGYTIHN